jgi:hypothetical protein
MSAAVVKMINGLVKFSTLGLYVCVSFSARTLSHNYYINAK